MLSRDGGDPVRNYQPDVPAEEMLPFWERAVDVQFDAITGITTARISFYSPEDARAVAEALVAELQRIVNGLTREARDDMLEYVNSEYDLAEAELNSARAAIEAFRRANKTFSPDEDVSIDSGIISELRGLINAKEVELATMRQQAPSSPTIRLIREEIASLNVSLPVSTNRVTAPAKALSPPIWLSSKNCRHSTNLPGIHIFKARNCVSRRRPTRR